MALQESLPVYGARRTNRAQGLHAGVLSGQRYCTDPRAAGTGLGPRSMAGPRQASAAAGGSSVRPQAYRLGMVANRPDQDFCDRWCPVTAADRVSSLGQVIEGSVPESRSSAAGRA